MFVTTWLNSSVFLGFQLPYFLWCGHIKSRTALLDERDPSGSSRKATIQQKAHCLERCQMCWRGKTRCTVRILPVFIPTYSSSRASQVVLMGKKHRRQERHGFDLGWEDPLKEEMAMHSGILAWRIPWTEESGGLQSVGSQRVRRGWSDWAYTHTRRDSSYPGTSEIWKRQLIDSHLMDAEQNSKGSYGKWLDPDRSTGVTCAACWMAACLSLRGVIFHVRKQEGWAASNISSNSKSTLRYFKTCFFKNWRD